MAGQRVKDVMQTSPRAIDRTVTVADAARIMEADDVGDVVVERDGKTVGIVTDRDIAVRAVARGLDVTTTPVEEVCSSELETIGPDATIDDAVRMMRERSIRRIPVVEDGRLVGVVSIGDLAVERDPESVLASISAAPPNR